MRVLCMLHDEFSTIAHGQLDEAQAIIIKIFFQNSWVNHYLPFQIVPHFYLWVLHIYDQVPAGFDVALICLENWFIFVGLCVTHVELSCRVIIARTHLLCSAQPEICQKITKVTSNMFIKF